MFINNNPLEEFSIGLFSGLLNYIIFIYIIILLIIKFNEGIFDWYLITTKENINNKYIDIICNITLYSNSLFYLLLISNLLGLFLASTGLIKLNLTLPLITKNFSVFVWW